MIFIIKIIYEKDTKKKIKENAFKNVFPERYKIEYDFNLLLIIIQLSKLSIIIANAFVR